jgi:hypothetical protein
VNERMRYVAIVKVKDSTPLSFSTLIDVLTKDGKTEAKVNAELAELAMLLYEPRATKAEFSRDLSILRTPFQP